jgi:hypothetical protein
MPKVLEEADVPEIVLITISNVSSLLLVREEAPLRLEGTTLNTKYLGAPELAADDRSAGLFDYPSKSGGLLPRARGVGRCTKQSWCRARVFLARHCRSAGCDHRVRNFPLIVAINHPFERSRTPDIGKRDHLRTDVR